MADAMPAPDAAPLPPPSPPPPLLVFPPRSALTSEATLRVRGVTDVAGTITGVTINGAPVVSTDGYATWHQDVALAFGANELQLSATLDDGSVVDGVIQTVVHSPTRLAIGSTSRSTPAATTRTCSNPATRCSSTPS